ncbi:MAG: D-cysteine desulfhydrase family protein [Anaerolineae bacterium]
MLKSLPRVSLGCWPTPLYELERLSRTLGGPHILIKRDDLSGLATGGNKTRKLELLIADALQQGADTVITAGAPQSNHAMQTAAAAARFGLQCVLVLGPRAPQRWNGNLLLDRLLGARIRWAGDRDRYTVMEEVAAEERAAGRKAYIIPYGGSNAIGAAAYALAMDELMRQLVQRGTHLDHIVFASSSGGTQAGMVVGARAYNLDGRILGISVDKPADAFRPVVLELARLTAAFLDLPLEITAEDITINDSYLGGGYAVLGDAEREAIRLVARTEGLVVDPVYTGRAMAGLIDLIRRKAFGKDETVLFWHTGGTSALFAYAEGLLEG